MVVKKISELVPKGAPLGNTDLLVVGVDNGFDYDLKSVTGAELLGNVITQTITNGDTAHSPSSDVVYDSLALKVDKITGKGLSTEDYTSAEKTKLSGLTGTNTGDQTLQTVTNLGNTTTNAVISATTTFVSQLTASQIQSSRISNSKRSSLNADGYVSLSTTGTSEATLKASNILNDITLEFPNKSVGSYTIATTTDIGNKVDSNTAITGATKTKITYDSKGLVTSGADATTSDIADSLNKRYVTDANLTTIGNQSGTNTGDQIISDATITTTDITTNNVSSTKHGFAPKTPNNTTTFLRGDGTWATPSAGGLTYFTEAQNTTSPNATVPVDSLTAVTGTTNGDFAIIPKGTGAILAQIPDGTATAGDKRGANSVDLQTGRTVSANVASGQYSVTLGYNNKASNTGSIAIGNTSYATGLNAIALGKSAFSTGIASCAIGGDSGTITASGDGSVAIGGAVTTASSSGAVALGSGVASNTNAFAVGYSTASGTNSVSLGGQSGGANFCQATGNGSFAMGLGCIADARNSSVFGVYTSSKGVAQRLSVGSFSAIAPYIKGSAQLSVSSSVTTTTTNTAIELTSYEGTAINLILQDNEAIRVKGSIIGKQTASTNVSCYDFDCVVVRGVGVATTILPLSNVNLVLDTITLGTIPALTANTTLGGLSVKSGAKTTTTIKWSCRIDSTEVILA